MIDVSRGEPRSVFARRFSAVVLVFVVVGCTGTAEPGRESPTASAPAGLASDGAATPVPTSAGSEPTLAEKFDVGGHSLYLECYGATGPLIVFDAGSGSSSSSWKRSRKGFIGLVDNAYRRCIYDRANLGHSDRVPGPRTSATAAEELHDLLLAAGLEPPYVLVGRSYGGYNVRLFAAAYPAEVVGLVLIETLTPEFLAGMEALLTPEQWVEEVQSFESVEPPLDEIASGPLVAAADLPDVPLLVIAGTKWHSGNAPWPLDWPGPALDALWDQVQMDLAATVPRGRLVVFEGGDHSLHFSQPERLAEEINAFLAEL